MKKFIIACVTVAFIGLGGAPVHAQEGEVPNEGEVPDECIDQPSDDPGNPCYNPVLYPPVDEPTSTTSPDDSVVIRPPTSTTSTIAPTTTTIKALVPNLPKTGSSGMAPILGMGALLLLGGGLIVVAARRRNTSTTPAA